MKPVTPLHRAIYGSCSLFTKYKNDSDRRL